VVLVVVVQVMETTVPAAVVAAILVATDGEAAVSWFPVSIEAAVEVEVLTQMEYIFPARQLPGALRLIAPHIMEAVISK
jgi:hypothetical protein